MTVGLLVSFSVFAQNDDQVQCESRPSSYGKTGAQFYTYDATAKKCNCIPSPDNCCGIPLYTNVPFVGKCIEYG